MMLPLSGFSPTQADLLKRFLGAPERPDDTLRYEETAGFLFAIACSPELIPPSEWLPLIFNEQEAGYGSEEEAKAVLEALMALYNHFNNGVQLHEITLPPQLGIRKPAVANLEDDAPLSGWARGFWLGHDYLIELWRDHTLEEFDEELGSCLLVLSFFSSPRLAEGFHKEMGDDDKSLEERAESITELFPDAMASYAHIGWSIQTVLQEQHQYPEPVRTEKIGRNEPCPCGSGKKYKKCCG